MLQTQNFARRILSVINDGESASSCVDVCILLFTYLTAYGNPFVVIKESKKQLKRGLLLNGHCYKNASITVLFL